jgi:hypothetical protein
MRSVARQKNKGARTTDVRGLREMILGVKTNTTPTVKKSISIPQAQYVWALKRAKAQGHNNVSRVLREGIDCLRRQQPS